MPLATRSTIATWLSASHQPRLVFAGSKRSVAISRLTRSSISRALSAPFVSRPLHQGLDDQRQDRQQREQRGYGERTDEVVFVIQDLNMQRHGVRQAAHVTGHYRDGAEFPHGTRVTENHAVDQS